MALKEYDTREAIPAEQREKALELKSGKFAVEEAVDVAALRAEGQRALDAERERANTEEKERKRVAKELADLKRTQEAKDKGISEEELQKIRDAEALARKPIEDENVRLKTENDKLKRTDKVRSLALTLGILPDRIEDAMELLDRRTELTDKGNVVAKDKNGTVLTESLEDFLGKTFKAEKPYLYAGPGGSGSGAAGSDTGGGGSGYDPAAAGKAAAAKQKASTGDQSLALKSF